MRLLHPGPLISKAMVAALAMSMKNKRAMLPMKVFDRIAPAASGCPMVLSAIDEAGAEG
jgi:hypothetical protein